MRGTMVRIAERIWPAWRAQAEQWDEPALLLLLSPAGNHAEAARAVRDSVLEIQDAYRAEAERSDDLDPPSAGEWDWVSVSDGVLVNVVECDVFEDVLPAVAAALERRGIEGIFDLPDRPTVATLPNSAHLLECRVRVRGQRLRREARAYLWQADPDAHDAFLAVAERWCRRRGGLATHLLTSGTVGPIPVESSEDVLDRMREAVVDRIHVEVSAVTADELRSAAARPWSGGVSLVVGGAWVEAGEWRGALAELTGVLRDHADLLAYAYVRRGWAVREALSGDSLPYDWPQRADHQPRGIGFTPQAFEDLYAPDAFAVQLLGRGYTGRVPESSAWRAEWVGGAAVLLEHTDFPAWFDAPFVPFRNRAWHVGRPQAPAVLARARVELAPILYFPGVLSRVGYGDAEG
jgi:hypothetical protein